MGYKSWASCLLIVAFYLFSFSGRAETIAYYGKEFYEAKDAPQLHSEHLRTVLNNVLKNWHLPVPGDFDKITENCNSKSCYIHTWQSYRDSRETMFGEIHLTHSKTRGYGVYDVYCDTIRYEEEFGSRPPRPGEIPNHTVVNAEHTWPQSKFSRKYSRDIQKSDLHSLYPVYSRVNSSRSNDPFGVVINVTSQICPASKKGFDENNQIVFEPPDNHKGNVARSLFYFSTRYEIPIPDEEEEVLRLWHTIDPVDDFEQQRNERVFQDQGNRNPFIDHPNITQHILNF